MTAKDTVLSHAVERQDVPFVVAMVAKAAGPTYTGCFGEAAPGVKAVENTVFRIFSMTKAVGSTAAMLLVDRGKLDPDTPVQDILPEFAEIQVLEGFEGDKPVLRAPRTKATARQLATHTSGLEYEFWNADMANYLAKTGHPGVLSGLKKALFYPMMTDPGTRWGYGPGIDWLGLMVEKIDGRRIDKFCREEIFEPLGMTDTAFEVSDAMNKRLAAVKIRGEDGTFGPFEIAPPPNPEVYGMGHALYSTAPDYIKFLRMYLNRGTLNGNRSPFREGSRMDVCRPDEWPDVPEDGDGCACHYRRFRSMAGYTTDTQLRLLPQRSRHSGATFGGFSDLGRRSQHALLVRPQEGHRRCHHDAVAPLRGATLHAALCGLRKGRLRRSLSLA